MDYSSLNIFLSSLLHLLQLIERADAFSKIWFFMIFKFSILSTNSRLGFFILTFLEFIENISVLFCHFFHIRLKKINWYNLTNFEYIVNKCNTKVSPHYWVLCLHSKNICYHIFVVYFLLICFGIFSSPKLSKYVILSPFTHIAIQWVSINLNSSKLDTHSPFFI